jgi:hypothetical protein
LGRFGKIPHPRLFFLVKNSFGFTIDPSLVENGQFLFGFPSACSFLSLGGAWRDTPLTLLGYLLMPFELLPEVDVVERVVEFCVIAGLRRVSLLGRL